MIRLPLLCYWRTLLSYILRGGWKAASCSSSGLDLLLMKLLVRISIEFTRNNTEVYVYLKNCTSVPWNLKLQLIKSKIMQRRKNDPKSFLYLLVVNNCKTLKINSSFFYSNYSIQNCKRKQKELGRSCCRFQFAPQHKWISFPHKKVLECRSYTVVFLSLSTSLPP